MWFIIFLLIRGSFAQRNCVLDHVEQNEGKCCRCVKEDDPCREEDDITKVIGYNCNEIFYDYENNICKLADLNLNEPFGLRHTEDEPSVRSIIKLFLLIN